MRVVFMGTGEIGVGSLSALIEHQDFDVVGVVTQPDRPFGRKQELKPSAVKVLAEEKQIPVFQPEDINQPRVLEPLKALDSDIAVVCAYGQILKREVLEFPRRGCLNIHASLLPKYRGAACIQAPLLKGEKETGVTIMWMDEGLDTGDILLQSSLVIHQKETAGSLHDRLAELAANVIGEALEKVAQKESPRVSQDQIKIKPSYVKKLKKEDGKIDWQQSAESIECHIRAMDPWPSAYSWIEDKNKKKMLKIFKAEVCESGEGGPGEIIEVTSDKIIVKTGKQGLLLEEVQLEGKKRLCSSDFLKGFPIQKGMKLG